MKEYFSRPLAVCLCFLAFAVAVSAQDSPPDQETKTEKILKATGKVAVETGKVAIKIGAAAVKSTAEQVIVPAAKIIWDPILTKAAPKIIGETAKLAGKGIKNGFKLIFKRDKEKAKDEGS